MIPALIAAAALLAALLAVNALRHRTIRRRHAAIPILPPDARAFPIPPMPGTPALGAKAAKETADA